MHAREHVVGIMPKDKGLMLVILRYADELMKPDSFFDDLKTEAKSDAVKLEVNFIEDQSGKFVPQKMPNEYAEAVREPWSRQRAQKEQ
jgi:DNA end-binding protein Ku